LETIETPHLIWYLFKWKTAKLKSVAIKVLLVQSISLPLQCHEKIKEEQNLGFA